MELNVRVLLLPRKQICSHVRIQKHVAYASLEVNKIPSFLTTRKHCPDPGSLSHSTHSISPPAHQMDKIRHPGFNIVVLMLMAIKAGEDRVPVILYATSPATYIHPLY